MLCLFSLHFWGQLLCHYNRYSPFFVCRHVIKWPADLQHFNSYYFYCIDHYWDLLRNARRFICTALQPRRKDRACGFGRPDREMGRVAPIPYQCRWVTVFVYFANWFESRKFRYSFVVNHRKFVQRKRRWYYWRMASVWLSAVHNLKWIEMSPCHALTRLVSLLLTSYSIIYNHHQLLN